MPSFVANKDSKLSVRRNSFLGLSPYLSDLASVCRLTRSLRSSCDDKILCIYSGRIKDGRHLFFFAGPAECNFYPLNLKALVLFYD